MAASLHFIEQNATPEHLGHQTGASSSLSPNLKHKLCYILFQYFIPQYSLVQYEIDINNKLKIINTSWESPASV